MRKADSLSVKIIHSALTAVPYDAFGGLYGASEGVKQRFAVFHGRFARDPAYHIFAGIRRARPDFDPREVLRA